MNSERARHLRQVDTALLGRIQTLLRKYPSISPEEVAEVSDFFSKGPLLERGLLSGDATIRSQLERFRKEHAGSTSLRLKDYLVAAAIIVAVVIAAVLLSDLGSRP